ncbi:DUF3231 family protein [Paenibacillus psychroresistens]|uniref:DUF3231 family protein n=1 Tax=Paenibacillus psychroresistens TaxID=1778678 RepID=A0A6B8RUG9_9BACL|nr:DUF3231 family protein [Paenibacillus psychroresistens]QGQ98936.1 DUF3231 family protein [Paenibacillus psychroresistens]
MKFQLNASEMTNLWTTYISNSASVIILRSFLHYVEDSDIKTFLEQGLQNAVKSVSGSKLFLDRIHYPLTESFGEADLNLAAPRLYTDKFCLFSIRRLSEYGMIVIGIALNTSLDKEVRQFYSNLLTLNIALYNQASDLSLIKGIEFSPPHIPTPEQVEYLNKKTAYKGFLGHPRTINGLEIKEIVFSLVGMIHAETILLGFSQVTKSKDILKHLLRGKEAASKQIGVLQTILKDDDLPTFPTIEDEVTQATEAPFSEKLMMFLTISLSQLTLARYGIAVSQCGRSDIIVDLTRLMAETADYLKDGSDLMLEKGWLEQPPMASNRDALVSK